MKSIVLSVILLVMLSNVYAYNGEETIPFSGYSLVVQPSGYASRWMMGVKQPTQRGPYFNPYRRGSSVKYVLDTYQIHRPDVPAYPVPSSTAPRIHYGSGNRLVGDGHARVPAGRRLPGLPFRVSGNRLLWVND